MCEHLICDLEAGLQQDERKSGVNFCCQPETETCFGTKHVQLLWREDSDAKLKDHPQEHMAQALYHKGASIS